MPIHQLNSHAKNPLAKPLRIINGQTAATKIGVSARPPLQLAHRLLIKEMGEIIIEISARNRLKKLNFIKKKQVLFSKFAILPPALQW